VILVAKLFRHSNGIGWLKITWLELAKYSGNLAPICDQCLKDIAGFPNIGLIPLLNQAYCPECGKAGLARMHNYPEDRPIAERREQFYMNYFGVKEVR
jgi:predicted amidophosphoribosyltransferase